jgi:hypothetical protein
MIEHEGSLEVRVAMMEMVLRDALELLAATHPEEERIMRKLALLPINNRGLNQEPRRDDGKTK